MTETQVEYQLGKLLDNKIPNLTLNDILMRHARELKAPNCQPPRERTGSTDFANVMHRVPGSCIRVAFVPQERYPIRKLLSRPASRRRLTRPLFLGQNFGRYHFGIGSAAGRVTKNSGRISDQIVRRKQ